MTSPRITAPGKPQGSGGGGAGGPTAATLATVCAARLATVRFPNLPVGLSPSQSLRVLLHASFPGCGLNVESSVSGFLPVADLSELALRIRIPDPATAAPVAIDMSGGKMQVTGCVDACVLLAEVTAGLPVLCSCCYAVPKETGTSFRVRDTKVTWVVACAFGLGYSCWSSLLTSLCPRRQQRHQRQPPLVQQGRRQPRRHRQRRPRPRQEAQLARHQATLSDRRQVRRLRLCRQQRQ